MTIRAILSSAAVIAAGLLHHPAGPLPLASGVYVDVGAPCRGAPTSARTWFGGGDEIQASHARCEPLSVVRNGPRRYVITSACRADGSPTAYRVVDRIKVISSTEYEIENGFGRFHSRWCRE